MWKWVWCCKKQNFRRRLQRRGKYRAWPFSASHNELVNAMKILLVGPSKSGKSALASFLAGISDSAVPAHPPLPTVGCRILELERGGVPVELWDVSGDQSYENCWPAIKHNADGIIFVYSSEAAGQAVRLRASAAAASNCH